LALIAMLSAVISAFIYLRIVLAMYGGGDDDAAAERPPRLRIPVMAKVALIIALVATIGFGFAPGPLNDASKTAVPSITATR
jgi:NADH-quinone oxidoreductase subunit N